MVSKIPKEKEYQKFSLMPGYKLPAKVHGEQPIMESTPLFP